MSDVALATPRQGRKVRFERYAPAILVVLALLIYLVVALGSGQQQYLTVDNLVAILGRSIALGITAIGQTFVILVASIDLSVASLISASAVLASVVMNGNPAMIVPGIAAVLALGSWSGSSTGSWSRGSRSIR